MILQFSPSKLIPFAILEAVILILFLPYLVKTGPRKYTFPFTRNTLIVTYCCNHHKFLSKKGFWSTASRNANRVLDIGFLKYRNIAYVIFSYLSIPWWPNPSGQQFLCLCHVPWWGCPLIVQEAEHLKSFFTGLTVTALSDTTCVTLLFKKNTRTTKLKR